MALEEKQDPNRQWLKTLLERLAIVGDSNDIVAKDTIYLTHIRDDDNYNLDSSPKITVDRMLKNKLVADSLAGKASRVLFIKEFEPHDLNQLSFPGHFCLRILDEVCMPGRRDEQLKQHTYVLRWFCREHPGRLGNATDMVKHLLAQLISQLLENKDLPSFQGIAVEQGDLSLPGLISLFQNLVGILSDPTTIWCVIDSIIYYEGHKGSSHKEACMEVMRMLIELGTTQVKDKPSFKLVVTAPLLSSLVEKLFKKHQVFMITDRERDVGW